MPEPKKTVEAGRRRPSGASGPSGRADAPERRPSGTGSSGLPPASTGGGSYRPSSPSGRPRNLSIGSLLLLIVLFFVLRLFMGGGSETGVSPEAASTEAVQAVVQPTRAPAARPTARPTQAQAVATRPAASGGDTWLVMLYQDADDKILEKDIYLDLNEAEKVGSSAKVNIVAQVDRFRGGFQGDGDWVSARRYFVTQDDDLQQVSSKVVAELGEVNMADAQTLVDFVTWAMQTYPASKYALILSDHGMGWPGGWSDATAHGADSSLPLGSVIGDQLYLHELDQALADIRAQSGLDKFELIGMDACLMGHIEVLSPLSAHALYAVTSQETEPALGWAYAAFLSDLSANPSMNGAELGQAIVNSYIAQDQRIIDEQQRADFAGPGLLMNSLFGGGVPSTAQLTRELIPNITLAAVDLSVVPELMESLNDLAYSFQEASAHDISQARRYAQSFTSIFGKDVPASYIDLGHFAQLVGQSSGERSVQQAAQSLQDVLGRAVIAEKHGQKKPGATGISIYFPNSALYRSPEAGLDSYSVAAQQFAGNSLWDDFLAFHYSGRGFDRGDRAVAVPERGAVIQAPAAGGIQVTPLKASARSVAPGNSIRLTSDISGANIGYVRLLVGYLDQTHNSINVIDSDYLESPDTRELNGVYYPDWGAQDFSLAFEWEPIVFAINDGSTTAVALLEPETYGASAEEAVYTVEGIYTFADSGERRQARLYFSNGQMRQVFGFTGEGGTGAPREITPQPGDTFTILEKWMDLDAQGEVKEVVQQEGDTLTFGEALFTWQELYAAPGSYVVGFIVEDLDGSSQTTFAQVTVR